MKFSDQDLLKIAVDMCEGEIFSSLDLPSDNSISTSDIFPALLYLKDDQLKILQEKKIGMIFEWKDKAIPGKKVAGFPVFAGCHLLDEEETKKVLAEYHRLGGD